MLKILDKLESGEHLHINDWEVFMSYTGTFWIRRDLTEKELEGFDDTEGWHQEYFETLEETLERVGIATQKQMSLF